MKLKSLDSAAIAAAGHDPERNVLRLRFHSGREYDYPNVTRAEYEELCAARSAGAHFNRHIRVKGGREIK